MHTDTTSGVGSLTGVVMVTMVDFNPVAVTVEAILDNTFCISGVGRFDEYETLHTLQTYEITPNQVPHICTTLHDISQVLASFHAAE